MDKDNNKAKHPVRDAGNGAGNGFMLRNALADTGKALLAGFIAAAVLGCVGFVTGLITGGNGAASGLEGAKNAMFAMSAVLLFILAGMLLIKGKKPEKSHENNGWRRHFACIGPKLAVAFIAAAFIIAACVLDYIQISLRFQTV